MIWIRIFLFFECWDKGHSAHEASCELLSHHLGFLYMVVRDQFSLKYISKQWWQSIIPLFGSKQYCRELRFNMGTHVHTHTHMNTWYPDGSMILTFRQGKKHQAWYCDLIPRLWYCDIIPQQYTQYKFIFTSHACFYFIWALLSIFKGAVQINESNGIKELFISTRSLWKNSMTKLSCFMKKNTLKWLVWVLIYWHRFRWRAQFSQTFPSQDSPLYSKCI